MLNGFDDPCSDVRVLAVECVSRLKLSSGCDEYKSKAHHSLIEYTVKKLVLHSEDPYANLRTKIIGK